MVLLINPKTRKPTETNLKFFREPNLGILYLAAILDNHNIDVEILDFEQYLSDQNFQVKDILESFFDFHDIYGISSLTNTFGWALEIAKAIKEADKSNIIIFGGPHVSFLYKEILNSTSEVASLIDFICIGEAEISFLQLVKCINSKSSIKEIVAKTNPKLKKIKGLAYRTEKGEIIYTGDSIAYNDLDKLPLPARYKLSPVIYDYNVANIIVNRGCPNQCSFCSRQNLFKQPRTRSVESILSEIWDIENYHSYKFMNFYDNINITNEFFQRFCNMFITHQISLPWGCEIRVDSITESTAELLNKAGCQIIATGIESASKKVLQKNFKFQDPKKVKEGIENIKKYDVPIQTYFVLGLPGETQQSFEKTIEYIRDLPLTEQDTINFFVATPYPGSRLWDEQEKFGIKIFENDFSKYDCEHLIFETINLSQEELKAMLKQAKEIEGYFS